METFISIPPLTNSSALKQPVAGAVELPLLGHKDLREIKATRAIRANKEFKAPKEIKVTRATKAIRASPDRRV